jgi:hypothetical protein
MGHQRVLDVDEVVLAEVLEIRPSEGLSQVGDNPVGYPEPMGDVLYEVCGLF